MRNKIKHLILPCCAFIFQYIIPILLFGNVIPFTHGVVKAGLTAGGYIALGILAFITINKLKEYLQRKPKSLTRGIVLSLFPIAIWLIIDIGLGAVQRFVNSFVSYWHYVIIFIIIGRIFYTIDEALAEKEREQIDGE